MMARQHALSGLFVGCLTAGALAPAPIPVKALTVAVAGGAALVPDLDHPSATVARSLGIVTRLLAVAIDRASLALYHATRAEGDPGQRRSGHRLVTHTVPGCLVTAAVVGLLCLAHPLAGAAAACLLVGLLGLGVRALGGGAALTAGGVTWWLLTYEFFWWWTIPLATFVGAFAHVIGDTFTNSGTPLWWPLLRDGRRWRLVTTPATFSTGDYVETMLVAPLLVFATALASLWPLGVVPLLFHLLASGSA